MKAYFADGASDRAIALSDPPIPTPKATEIVVAVRAAGVNRFDVMAAEGYRDPRLPKDAPTPLGLECAGEVVKVGADVKRWAIGDRVMGRCWGGFAEFAVMKQDLAIRKPERLGWPEAATMHVLVVAYDAVITNGVLREKEALLVNAASSGIGIASMQIGELIGAAPIIGTTRSVTKLAPVLKSRLSKATIISADDFAPKVLELTQQRGADVVADSVGGSVLGETLQCMALLGRLVSIGRLGAIRGELDMDLLALKRIKLIGVTNRTRTEAEQAEIVKRFSADVLPALADGRLRPLVDQVYSFTDALKAVGYLANNSQVGKVVLTL
jgi:NADPH:quinone reductase